MNAQRLVRSFVVLTALQSMPLGLLVVVEILIMQARGLTASQIGLVIVVITLVTAVLELPTGGLADVLGRRVVLVAGAAFTLASLVTFALAASFALFMVAGALFAVGRALQSGPLEAWFVDAVNDIHEPGEQRAAVLTRGMGRAGSALGLGLAVGAMGSGALAGLAGRGPFADEGREPLIALSVPLLVAAALVVAQVAGLFLLMAGDPRPGQGIGAVIAGIGPAITDTAQLVATDPLVRFFGLRWLVVSTGFLAFEFVTPIRLTELLTGTADAAAVLGPLIAACFVASAITSPLAPLLRRRVGALLSAGLITLGAGVSFVVGGYRDVTVLVIALVVAHLVIGPINALTMPFLHARVSGQRRATLLSFQSVVANVSAAGGAVVLGLIIETWGTPWAFAVAGSATALAALPLIGVARVIRSGR